MVHSYGLIKKEDYPVIENLLCNILDNKKIGSEDLTKIIEAILIEKIEEREFDQTNADIISKLDCELFHKSLRNNVITDIKLEETFIEYKNTHEEENHSLDHAVQDLVVGVNTLQHTAETDDDGEDGYETIGTNIHSHVWWGSVAD